MTTTATATKPVDRIAEVGAIFRRDISGGTSPDGTPLHGPHHMTIVRDAGWNLDDFGHHFLWACHAIRWGVEQYATATHQAAVPGEASK